MSQTLFYLVLIQHLKGAEAPTLRMRMKHLTLLTVDHHLRETPAPTLGSENPEVRSRRRRKPFAARRFSAWA